MNEQVRKQMAAWGRKGGKATLARHGAKHFSKIRKQGIKVGKKT